MQKFMRPMCLAFIGMHIAALITPFVVPITWTSFWLLVGFYFLRMFGISAGYHRLFSHKAYKTSRVFQFLMGFIGSSALQKGVFWWSDNHREHHRYSDTEKDPHSPIKRSVWWAHIGWILDSAGETNPERVKDLLKFPELRYLDYWNVIPGVMLAVLCFVVDGWSGFFWSFVVGTVVLYHATFLVNSVCHLFGTRRFETDDRSRNNPVAALLTLGEGWHNNHHHRMHIARQGIMWWEIDISYYILRLLQLCGIVWDIKEPPKKGAPVQENELVLEEAVH